MVRSDITETLLAYSFADLAVGTGWEFGMAADCRPRRSWSQAYIHVWKWSRTLSSSLEPTTVWCMARFILASRAPWGEI